MPERFKAHLNKFVAVTDDEAVRILSYFQTKTVTKKENLLTAGQVCQWLYFVERGILRKFYVNEKGVEQTTELAIENWWITAIPAGFLPGFYARIPERNSPEKHFLNWFKIFKRPGFHLCITFNPLKTKQDENSHYRRYRPHRQPINPYITGPV